jgi:pSer/pThr/pTyr-binding forkhead associated (FHA) protein
MWILELLDEKNNLTILRSHTLAGQTITIGRSVDGDIVFPSDRSISRKHAELRLESNSVFVLDLKSTLGTFVNGNRIRPSEKVQISSGTIIKFGNEHTTVRILEIQFKFCPTRLEKPEKEKLKTIVGLIGAEIVKQVETCSHVLCNRFSATVKTLTAIVLQKPIVSLHWVEAFANCTSNSVIIPDVKE